MHRLSKKRGKVNDCCKVFSARSYRGLDEETIVDARMTMFIPLFMLESLAFPLTQDDLEEIEDCLLVALELS